MDSILDSCVIWSDIECVVNDFTHEHNTIELMSKTHEMPRKRVPSLFYARRVHIRHSFGKMSLCEW
jgi:hypothetical protein